YLPTICACLLCPNLSLRRFRCWVHSRESSALVRFRYINRCRPPRFNWKPLRRTLCVLCRSSYIFSDGHFFTCYAVPWVAFCFPLGSIIHAPPSGERTLYARACCCVDRASCSHVCHI